jgi:hypothetical protein
MTQQYTRSAVDRFFKLSERGSTTGREISAYGGWADSAAESVEFAVDTAVSPAGVLGGEPGDEVADVVWQRWTSWWRGLGPLLGDQALVPGQEGAWGDDPVLAQGSGE